eukprot:SAG31_NODE_20651_length_568_cov_1.799574_1_plen_107_part_10
MYLHVGGSILNLVCTFRLRGVPPRKEQVVVPQPYRCVQSSLRFREVHPKAILVTSANARLVCCTVMLHRIVLGAALVGVVAAQTNTCSIGSSSMALPVIPTSLLFLR